ncbi:hypothetical protein P8452_62168 [Trifolium repens]|nr:hypothetical protein P8452_62168 [Trifolium repens]
MEKPKSLLIHYCNYRYLLCLLIFTCACSARQLPRQPSQFNECQLDSIDLLEPDNRIQSEAGLTEIWDADHHPELRCVGVSVLKRTINPNGLHLPSYVSYPEIHFVEQGTGVLGMAIPGCAETYEEPQWEKGGRPQHQQDRHQKVRYVKQGDIVAIPPGVPYWTYNYGDTPLTIITLLDTSNKLNQLDRVPRRFYLAGNPETEHQKKQSGRKQQEEESNNMFSGFDSRFLGQVLKVKEKIRSEEAKRHREHGEKKVEKEEEEVEDEPGKREHHKWRKETRKHREGECEGKEEEVVEEKETKTKESRCHHGGEREREGQKGNFMEQTVCTLKLHDNIADPSRADVFNPRAGRINTVNSLTLPILKLLHLSAQWVNLYKDGIFVPHWNMNANSVVYVTRGRGRVQVVNSEGKSVFNEEVKRGKLFLVPQDFAVAEQAGDEGLEYIVFKTNDRAEISTMVGRDSAISATPAEVLGHVFGLSPHEVNELKNNRNEGVLATPDSRIHDGYIAMV